MTQRTLATGVAGLVLGAALVPASLIGLSDSRSGLFGVPGARTGNLTGAGEGRINPTLERAERSAGSITTRSPEFPGWFAKAVALAKRTWRMPRVVNRHGKVVTEEDFLLSIILIESKGVHRQGGTYVRSGKGATGFMQLMPGTAARMRVDRFDPYQNLIGGVKYLAICFASKGANRADDTPADRLSKAAAAYNTGENRRALIDNTWPRFVASHARYLDETTDYGIQLKMALALPLSPQEEEWEARHRRYASTAQVARKSEDTYRQRNGLIDGRSTDA